MELKQRIKEALEETNIIVKADDLAKIEPKLSDDDVVKVIDEDEEEVNEDEVNEENVEETRNPTITKAGLIALVSESRKSKKLKVKDILK